MTDLAVRTPADAGLIEKVVAEGDLRGLTPAQRTSYYLRVCESLGLNPFTRPFEYITLNNKLVLYARKDATDQLRASRGVDLSITSREKVEDLYVVTARATINGRSDEEIGAVNIAGLKGEALANAMMKASTKAKRRVTLSIVGLGMLDESEVASVPDARPVTVDADGVIVEHDARPVVVDAPAQDGALLDEARALFRRARSLGLKPGAPTSKDPGALRLYVQHWTAEIDLRQSEMDQAASDAQAINDAVDAEVAEAVPAEFRSSPRWAGTELEKRVSQMADRLIAASKRFALPPDDASDADVEAWLVAKDGSLKVTGASK